MARHRKRGPRRPGPPGLAVPLACASALFLLFLPATSPAVAQAGEAPGQAECREESGSVVFGTVRETRAGLPLPGSHVTLRWSTPRGASGTVQGRLRTTADRDGAYRFCDIPAGADVTLWAAALGRTGGSTNFRAAARERRRQDLTIGLARETTGAVAGRITDAETDRPLEAVELRIEERNVTVLTDRSGRFRIPDVASGEHELLVRRLGHGTRTLEVRVAADETLFLAIELDAAPIGLDPIRVTVQRRPRWLEAQGFYERQRTGLGQFIGPEDLERRSPTRFSHVLENVPGLRLRPICQPHCSFFVRTTTSSGLCTPAFYIDGRQLRLPAVVDLDALVPAHDVAAVEVYRGISQTPARYYGMCGSVVIWTKRAAS